MIFNKPKAYVFDFKLSVGTRGVNEESVKMIVRKIVTDIRPDHIRVDTEIQKDDDVYLIKIFIISRIKNTKRVTDQIREVIDLELLELASG